MRELLKKSNIPAGRRIIWLDMARTFAILSVILCHSVEAIFPLDLDSVLGRSDLFQIIIFMAFTIGRLGVLIFFLLSGYLLLGREYNSERIFVFWKKNLWPLFAVTEIWIVLYNIFLCVFYQTEINYYVLSCQSVQVKVRQGEVNGFIYFKHLK